MTPPRRKRKFAGLLWVALGLAWATPGGAPAATGELVVVDHHSGLAIGGYDPVAYFVDRKAVAGRAEFEWAADGAVWRFRNEGNRAAFRAAPQVYRPRFGGYDPIGVTRGAGAAGHPELWTVVDQRLYLFTSAAARDAFVASAAAIVAEAERRWPQVLRTLSP